MANGLISDEIENVLNSTYGKTNKIQIAQKLLKSSVEAGKAVVNILGATGIAGFKFNIPETEQVKLESEITDQYTDINSPIQDHIALKAVVITLTGLVGDYFYSINKIEDTLALITPTVALVKEYLPQMRQVTQRKLVKHINNDKINIQKNNNGSYTVTKSGRLYEYSFNSMDLFSLFQSLYKLKSAQTRAFLFFEALWKSKAPFTVETTWKRYDNMVVQSVTPKRDRNADITQFTVVCKQLEFTQSMTETIEEYSNRVEAQKAVPIDKGLIKGEDTPIQNAIDNMVGNDLFAAALNQL